MSYQNYNTSSAYKLDNLESFTESKTTTKKPALKKKTSKKGVLVDKIKALSMVAAVIILAFMMVRGYVQIDEMNGNIAKLKKEHSAVIAENQTIQTEIDKNLDIEELQRIATEEYNMTRPERYQMFYVDLEMGDFAENTANKTRNEKEEKINVAGVPGIITGALNIFN